MAGSRGEPNDRPKVKLLPDERGLEFEGFTQPSAAYRVDPTRVFGAGCLMVVLVVMSIAFVAGGILFLEEAEQNVWLLLLIFWGFAGGWIVMTMWMWKRLAPGRKQRVLLYPEGIAFWRDDRFAAYAWREIASVTPKADPTQAMQGLLVLWATVGKDFEVRVKFEDGTSVTLTALLLGVVELADRIKERAAAAKEPAPWKGGKPAPGGTAEAGDGPFKF